MFLYYHSQAVIKEWGNTLNVYFSKVFLVVLGRPSEATEPTKNKQATVKIGMVGSTRTNRPNMLVPRMAPILAMRRCVPVAVVRRLVGYTSAMMRLVSFQAGVETAVKMHSMAMTKTSEESM